MNTISYLDLIGVAYEEKDCWQIARDFYSKVFGIGLYRIYDGPPQVDREVTKNLIYSSMGEFEKHDIPKFGDLVVLIILGVESHIGVYIGEGRFLHTSKRIGSRIEMTSRWEKSIVGYYRLKENFK